MNPVDGKDTGAILPDKPTEKSPLKFIIGAVTPGSGSIRTLTLARQDDADPNSCYITTVTTNDPAIAEWGSGHQVVISGGNK